MLARCSVIRFARPLRYRGLPSQTSIHRTQINARRHASTNYGGQSSFTWATTNNGNPPSVTASNIAPLGALVDELDTIAPRFEVEDGSIEVIEGPVQFYETLKTKILKAKKRIYLSTLYIGKTEHELISTIRTALQENPALSISVLTDALRGTRETPDPTTASILAPLISEFGQRRVQIRMFHTPNLTGLRKRLIPKRINEGWGLQHMKLYGIDDEIILSGANLSQDYFTNRLDRYHVFRSAQLTEYYERIHSAVSAISFDIQPDTNNASGYIMSWPSTNPGPNPLQDKKAYILHASSLISPLISPSSTHSKPDAEAVASSESRTFVYPIFQLAPLLPQEPSIAAATTPSMSVAPLVGQSTELPAITKLLTHLLRPPFTPTRLTFTAGYFNPSPSLVDLLLNAAAANPQSSPRLDVIAASPYANGFYGSKGVSGMLPAAYTLLCRRFLEEAQRRGTESSVRLREWRRGTVGEEGAWTYHAKGIWVTLPDHAPTAAPTTTVAREETHTGVHTRAHPDRAQDQDVASHEPGPSVTLIGSSNYTLRSCTLDLEANALVLTRDPALQRRLREEEGWLGRDAGEVRLREYERTERRVGVGVRIAMWITRVVGGAL